MDQDGKDTFTAHYLARINLALGVWQSVHGVVGSKCVLAILVDEKPGMHRKGMPGTSECELPSELLGSKMDQVEPSWSGTAISYQTLTQGQNLLCWLLTRNRDNIHRPTNHLDPRRLANPATATIAANKIPTAHGVLVAMDIDERCKHAVCICILDVCQILPAKPRLDLCPGQDDIFQPGFEEDLHASMAWFGGLAAVVGLLD